ncbi:MAG: HAD hydrolase-like protein [Clostridia bacterium]|nr:HAD hydrolase-like protein [Clostridia bacterium]
MSKYDLAVFDLDGTLLDTRAGVISALRYTIDELGYKMPDEETLNTFIGPPVQDSFARVYGLEGSILQDIATLFRNYYSTKTLLEAKLYDGIIDVFSELCNRGIKPAVATYKREDYAVKLLCHFGFDKYTDIMFGGDHENKLKKRDIIEKCISVGGVSDIGRVVMIGDTDLDAIGAEAVGADFIGVSYGFGFKTLDDIKTVKSVGGVDRAIDLLKFFD